MVKEIGLCFQNRALVGITLGFLALASFSPVLAGKGGDKGGSGKPSPNPGVDVELRDDVSSDKILSDGQGLYVDGIGGVYALINESNCPDTPACGDFVFDSDADFGRRDAKQGLEPRSLTIILDSPVNGSSGLGEIDEGAFLNVDGVGTVESGSATQAAVIHFSAGSLFLDVTVSSIGNGCWVVNSGESNVASHRISTTPGVWVEQGQYYLPFEMEICPQ